MQQSLFVWLGSKRAKKRGVGEKGALLDYATRFRLPVPAGGILLADFYRLALEDGLFVEENGRITCLDPDLLHEAVYDAVRFPKLDKPVAVRAAFSVGNGRFPAQLHTNFTDPVQLTHALCKVYTSAIHQPDEVRRDVVVMEMVAVVMEGTAVTNTAQAIDTITYHEQSHALPQLGAFQSVSPHTQPFAQRLQKLLRGVRRTFGKGEWMVDWIDDGEVCWLIQITRLRT